MDYTRIVNCDRCGRKVETDRFRVHECPYCENIKFSRESFLPIERQFFHNFQDILQSDLSPIIKAFYMFGSYAMEKPQCGDIDYLIVIDKEELESLKDDEIDQFHVILDIIEDESDYLDFIEDGLWDFRTCREYPDCLECHEFEECSLPEEDYSASLHTFCLEKCRTGNPDPVCKYADCIILDMEMKDHILKEMHRILTKGGIEYRDYAPGQRIKVIDIVIKNSVEELIEEFQSTGVEKELKFVELWNEREGWVLEKSS